MTEIIYFDIERLIMSKLGLQVFRFFLFLAPILFVRKKLDRQIHSNA